MRENRDSTQTALRVITLRGQASLSPALLRPPPSSSHKTNSTRQAIHRGAGSAANLDPPPLPPLPLVIPSLSAPHLAAVLSGDRQDLADGRDLRPAPAEREGVLVVKAPDQKPIVEVEVDGVPAATAQRGATAAGAVCSRTITSGRTHTRRKLLRENLAFVVRWKDGALLCGRAFALVSFAGASVLLLLVWRDGSSLFEVTINEHKR